MSTWTGYDYYPTEFSEKRIYENLWRIANAESTGEVGGTRVVDILKKSRVDLTILREIWSLCTDSSTMNQLQFFLALRYIAMYQNGEQYLSMDRLIATKEVNFGPPIFHDIPNVAPSSRILPLGEKVDRTNGMTYKDLHHLQRMERIQSQNRLPVPPQPPVTPVHLSRGESNTALLALQQQQQAEFMLRQQQQAELERQQVEQLVQEAELQRLQELEIIQQQEAAFLQQQQQIEQQLEQQRALALQQQQQQLEQQRFLAVQARQQQQLQQRSLAQQQVNLESVRSDTSQMKSFFGDHETETMFINGRPYQSAVRTPPRPEVSRPSQEVDSAVDDKASKAKAARVAFIRSLSFKRDGSAGPVPVSVSASASGEVSAIDDSASYSTPNQALFQSGSAEKITPTKINAREEIPPDLVVARRAKIEAAAKAEAEARARNRAEVENRALMRAQSMRMSNVVMATKAVKHLQDSHVQSVSPQPAPPVSPALTASRSFTESRTVATSAPTVIAPPQPAPPVAASSPVHSSYVANSSANSNLTRYPSAGRLQQQQAVMQQVQLPTPTPLPPPPVLVQSPGPATAPAPVPEVVVEDPNAFTPQEIELQSVIFNVLNRRAQLKSTDLAQFISYHASLPLPTTKVYPEYVPMSDLKSRLKKAPVEEPVVAEPAASSSINSSTETGTAELLMKARAKRNEEEKKRAKDEHGLTRAATMMLPTTVPLAGNKPQAAVEEPAREERRGIQRAQSAFSVESRNASSNQRAELFDHRMATTGLSCVLQVVLKTGMLRSMPVLLRCMKLSHVIAVEFLDQVEGTPAGAERMTIEIKDISSLMRGRGAKLANIPSLHNDRLMCVVMADGVDITFEFESLEIRDASMAMLADLVERRKKATRKFTPTSTTTLPVR